MAPMLEPCSTTIETTSIEDGRSRVHSSEWKRVNHALHDKI